GQGMQYQLAVAEIDALGVAGGAGGVERGCHTVFIKVGKIKPVSGLGQQGFVFAPGVDGGGLGGVVVGDLNPGLDGLDVVFHAFDDRHEIVVNQHHIIFGMVHGVDDLLRRQPNVYRVQNGANHRDGKETLKVSGRVPVHHGHGVAGFYAGIGECVRQAVNALNQIFVGVLAAVGIDDFLIRVVPGAGHQ